jgi:2-polyprenyl-6-methoxyphenol hydroxylase-like FAD-dependent oxidoreductase
MGLHWGAPVLRTLISTEAWSRIQSVQVDPNISTKSLDTLYFLNGKTGSRMAAAEIDNFYRLKRSKLRSLLSENLDIRFGKRLLRIEYSEDKKSVTAFFEDGAREMGCLVVGADGARSVTRNLVVGTTAAASRKLPIAATFCQATFTREQALFLRSIHPLYLAAVHPSGYFSFLGIQDASDASAPETWIFFFYISWGSSLEEQAATADWDNEKRLTQIKEKAKEYADPWKSAFEWLPDNHPVWYMGMTDWDPAAADHKWDNHSGLVTLAGDAAHTMTYQRGQGLNHSITDAAKINDAIKSFRSGQIDQKTAINLYEKEMIERAGAEVQMSSQNTKMLHEWEKAVQSPLFRKGLDKHS